MGVFGRALVTDNLVDFPTKELDKFNIEAVTADSFLTRAFESQREAALPIMRNMQAEYNMPAFSPSEFFLDLAEKGLPSLATCVRDHWNDV